MKIVIEVPNYSMAQLIKDSFNAGSFALQREGAHEQFYSPLWYAYQNAEVKDDE
jgi:hypothetical protein